MITDSELLQLRKEIYLALVAKSGVREWEQAETHAALWTAAIDAADGLLGIESEPEEGGEGVALPDYFKRKDGTPLTMKASGGTSALSVASLANSNGTTTGMRQGVTLDLGDASGFYPEAVRLSINRELAATPTASNAINFYGSWQAATGAGDANTSGSDASYTGYSSNNLASVKQLEFLGSHICTANATTQKSSIVIYPKGRYLNLVEENTSGAAYAASETNQVLTFTPIDPAVID